MSDTLTLEWFFTGSLYGIHRKHYLELPNGDVAPVEFHWEKLSDISSSGPRSCGVYSIDSGDRQKIYVGSSSDVIRRLWQHRSGLHHGRHKNRGLLNSFRDSGRTMVRFAEVRSLDEARYIEQALLDYGFSGGRLFNVQPLSTSPLGMRHSTEARQRMSEHAMRRVLSPEVKLDVARRISARLKGVALPEDHRAKLSSLNTAKWADDEFRKHWSEKTKRAVVVSGIVYDSLTTAGQALGVTPSRVRSRILSDNSKFVDWSYVSEVSTRKQRITLPRI